MSELKDIAVETNISNCIDNFSSNIGIGTHRPGRVMAKHDHVLNSY